MLALARLVWYPHIHSKINAQARNCRQRIDIGKKLKPLIPKNVFPDFVAETCNECDTNTAIEYLESYCKLHGIPCAIRCDPAQAFKAKNSKLSVQTKNIKLILAPAGDHRGTGNIERLIHTIKRLLAVLDIYPNWSNATLAHSLANFIENIRLNPNTTTKITPFEAHFGRKPNTEISNITTKTSHINLRYKNLTKYCLDKNLLKQNALTMEEIC